MFSHLMLGVNDLERGKRFYDALLGPLGVAPGVANKNRYFYRSPTGIFAITTPINGEPATPSNGSTTGFVAHSAEQVDTAHDQAVAAGGQSIEDAPGWRGNMDLAYLRDPDGNKLCLTYRKPEA